MQNISFSISPVKNIFRSKYDIANLSYPIHGVNFCKENFKPSIHPARVDGRSSQAPRPHLYTADPRGPREITEWTVIPSYRCRRSGDLRVGRDCIRDTQEAGGRRMGREERERKDWRHS